MRLQGLSVLFFSGLLFLTLFLASGCSDSGDYQAKQTFHSAPVPKPGGVYRIPLRGNPSTLDPVYLQDKYGVALVHQIFDGLVRFDQSLAIRPSLAETWQVKDKGRTYRFVLRNNAVFHNQEPVTADDVAFSFARLLKAQPAPVILPHFLKIVGASEYRAGTRQSVEGLVVESDTVISVHLETPYVPFLTALGMYQAAIVPEKEVRRLGKNFGEHPVGSGPFSFASWDKGRSIRLKRFNAYFGKTAYLDELFYKIYPGGQDPTVLSDFMKGQLEEMEVYGDVKKRLKDTNGLQWFHRPSLSLFFYGMNVSHPNLSNPIFRHALSTSINRQMFVNQVYNGQFEIAQTILPPGMPGYTPAGRDTDRASGDSVKPMGQEQVWGTENKPVEIEIVSALKTPRVEQEMKLISGFWSKIGVSVSVKYITDWNKFEAYIKSDKVQIYRYAWFADIPDPDSFMYSLFASSSPANYMKFENSDVDRMLLAARGIIDPVDRAKMYQKVESKIMELTPLIPLFYMNVDMVCQANVKSVQVNALGAHTIPLNHVWLDRP